MKKIKALTITSTGLYVNDGISTILYDYFRRFDKEKIELHIVASGRYRKELVDKFEKIGIEIKYLPSRKEKTFLYFGNLVKLIRKERYDAVYVHGSSALLSIELLAAMIAGCPNRIVHCHNTRCDHEKIDTYLRPVFYNLYTDAFACGEDAGKWLFGQRKFTIIRNGRSIETYRFNHLKRETERKKLGLGEECLAIGHVGNFNSQKNQKYLVYVFNELCERKENVKLFFVGDGGLKKQIEKLVDDLKIGDQVVFLGSDSSVSDVLQAMDVMALPSLYEGLPLVAVEWQMAGLPCLISDCVTRECAFTDLVHFEPLESGYISWANKLLSISQKAGKRDDTGIEKEAKAAGFDIDIESEKLQEFFLNLSKA